MDEKTALSKMVPPGQIRPGKMGEGGVIQVHLTRACSMACRNCTQGSQYGGKTTFMPLDLFEQAVLSLKGYFGLVALFGGQPTLHPQFPEICKILAKHVRIEKRGLWTNALNGHGAICRKTFLPSNCNLNVHLSQKEYDEFKRDWPECNPVGLHQDSRHAPVFVSMKDIGIPEDERWELISKCCINIHWSALMGMFRGELRAWFCEVAGASSMLHQYEPDYPDTGIPIFSGYARGLRRWWELPMEAFADQVRQHCHDCGVPLRGYGQLAQDNSNAAEQVSATHQNIATSKRRRPLELVTDRKQLQEGHIESVVRYLQNSSV